MVSRELEKTRGILTTCDWGQGQSPKGLSQIYIFKNWSVMSKKKNWSVIFIIVTLLLSYISRHITHLLSYISFFWIYTTEVSLRPSLLLHVRVLKIFSILKKKKKSSSSYQFCTLLLWVCLDWAYFCWNWKLKLKTL